MWTGKQLISLLIPSRVNLIRTYRCVLGPLGLARS